MILSDEDIKREIGAKRIVFEPKLKKDQLGGASVDLTLDCKFWIFKSKYVQGDVVDLDKISFKDAITEYKGEEIILDPGAMCLGITEEKITLAEDIMGTLEGRSRYARMGLAVHITSALVQPGVSNHQVLEIVNFAPFPIKLSAGMRISQIVFQYLFSPSTKPYRKHGKIAKRQ
jgi:dCTP deaminase